jgi:hypothetical protein
MLDTTDRNQIDTICLFRLLFCTATRVIASLRVMIAIATLQSRNAALPFPRGMIRWALESCCVEPPLSDLVVTSPSSLDALVEKDIRHLVIAHILLVQRRPLAR